MTPEARAQVEAYEQGRRDLARAGGYVPPATEYALEGIEAGWPLYSTARRYDDDYPVGGVVVDVLPAYTDPDTGEITPLRYRCLDAYRGRVTLWQAWQTLTADEIALPLEGINRARATTAGYWLLDQIPRRLKVFRPADVDHLHDAWTLAKAAAYL